MKVASAFKVRDPQTGLFQTGGCGPKGTAAWSKVGKAWSTAGHLKSHFALMRQYAHFGPPTITLVGRDANWKTTYETVPNPAVDPIDPNWEIIEFQLIPTQVQTKTAKEFMEKK